jgi:hypothetical protein
VNHRSVITALFVTVSLALFAGAAFAQPFASQTVGVNVGLCPSCSPQIQGGVFYAKRITDNAHPTYSYSHINVDQLIVNSVKPLKIQAVTSMETGVAQHVGKFGRFDLWGLATGGLALDSTNTGLSVGGGGMATTAIGKNRDVIVGVYGGPSKTAIAPNVGWKIGLTLGYGVQ